MLICLVVAVEFVADQQLSVLSEDPLLDATAVAEGPLLELSEGPRLELSEGPRLVLSEGPQLSVLSEGPLLEFAVAEGPQLLVHGSEFPRSAAAAGFAAVLENEHVRLSMVIAS